MYLGIGGCKGGGCQGRAPPGPNYFNFIQYLGSCLNNSFLHPPFWRPHLGEILDLPLFGALSSHWIRHCSLITFSLSTTLQHLCSCLDLNLYLHNHVRSLLLQDVCEIKHILFLFPLHLETQIWKGTQTTKEEVIKKFNTVWYYVPKEGRNKKKWTTF